ncbi:MAG TPA: ABC transporter substrate-binding protein [Caulobacteraceae bacterium]
MKTLLTVIAFAAATVISSSVMAADPAVGRIEALDNALLSTMKEGAALGAKGRFRKLEPVVQSAFDLPLMTRFAVGPAWTSMSEADHQALIRAFTRLTTASYAHNFDRFNGEKFEVSPEAQTRGPDKIVQSRLIPTGRAAVSLTYRMRLSGGQWKIVDVYFDAISQLTTRRSDFAAPLAAEGEKGLLAHLEETSAKLLQ